MKSIFKAAMLTLILSTQNIHAVNPVFCWLMDLQGCPGVEVEQGRARGLNNSGGAGIGGIGAKSEKVEKRTIITIPDHKMRSIMRFFGLGGTRINISYQEDQQRDCLHQDDILPNMENPLFESGSFNECLQALGNDLNELPNGINLRIVQCEEIFCRPTFIQKFQLFLDENPKYQVRETERFLGCRPNSVDI